MLRTLPLTVVSFVACTATQTVTLSVPPRPSDNASVHTLRPVDCSTGSACATLVVDNEMSSMFVLDATQAWIDEQPISTDPVNVTVGRHEVVVDLTFHWVSTCVYCQARAWKFVVHGKHTFDVTTGRSVELHAIAYEKGGVTTPLEERPAIRFTP